MKNSVTKSSVMKKVKEFEYKDHKCIIVKNKNKYSEEWLCAYVFLPEYNVFYKKHVKENPDPYSRCDTAFNGWFYNNVPYCTWVDSIEDELCIGLDLCHYWNVESGTTLDTNLAENQLKEMVDFIVDNHEEIKELTE